MSTSLMLCTHKKTKDKLIAWATTDRERGHLQGFKYARCCTYCGKEVKNNPLAHPL